MLADAFISLEEIKQFRYRVCSQIDEDGVLEYVFSKLDLRPLKVFVEIGVSGSVTQADRRGKLEGNAVNLRNKGWIGWLIDSVRQDEQLGINKAFITPENILETLSKLGCPYVFDLFSIDIDSLEYYVLKEFLRIYSPKVIVSEYNCIYSDKRTVSRKADFNWKDDLFGVSGPLLKELLASHDYSLFHTNRVNAFFVKNSEISLACKDHLANLEPEFYPLYPITSNSDSWLIIP